MAYNIITKYVDRLIRPFIANNKSYGLELYIRSIHEKIPFNS